jgi:hypothetical protein
MIEVLKEVIEVAAVTFFSVLAASIVVGHGLAAIVSTDTLLSMRFQGEKGYSTGYSKSS